MSATSSLKRVASLRSVILVCLPTSKANGSHFVYAPCPRAQSTLGVEPTVLAYYLAALMMPLSAGRPPLFFLFMKLH